MRHAAMRKFVLLLPVFMIVACASTNRPPTCDELVVVVFGAQVSPDGVLERFQVHEPTVCEGKPAPVELTRGFMVSACMYQALNRTKPTYDSLDEPQMLYWWAIWDLRRPHRFRPFGNDGQSPDQPVVHIQEDLPADLDSRAPNHVCAGSLDEHAA